MTLTEKPTTFKEVEALVNAGKIEILIQDDVGSDIRFLVCDLRRTYEEGEIYEVVVKG